MIKRDSKDMYVAKIFIFKKTRQAFIKKDQNEAAQLFLALIVIIRNVL